MFNPFHELGAKVGRTVRAMILACAAGAAGIAALFFFSLGAFLWLRELYGTVPASLALGGAYTFVAIVAAVAILVVRHRHPAPEPPAQKPMPQWWADPMMLTAGVEVLKLVGRRRTLPLALAAVLAGFALSSFLTSRSDPPPPRPRSNGSGTDPHARR
ncbi:MAG TPA: hypothetical protein VNR11_15130 [Xanthobacteraceae bacterium]|nr:hypothetical protein [Xanthobacteraceae bacterium]